MPVSVLAVIAFAAFICAVFSLAGKVHAAVPALLLAVLALLQFVGR